ncbi:prepilin-type N-terminal cleavage/methylation domain-containing protein [Rummeliibacillus suwonensis]|uniref:prepilin-type N-terminal cleavage/methylation domain-containing protein n=1 Tax=Rummeliibacillus suwonensis TaxID=1306154 RepID=UPI0028A2BD60|nr:prepilin-type N-terminal cleavage/methylation domain-containing protein [Rummeliibacillus suwonensis]
MKAKFKKLMKNQKGMTLIELLAVIVIIAIIALIAIPAIGNIINNSHDKAILADASNIISGAKIAVQDGACTEASDSSAVTCSETQLKDYVDNVKGTGYSAEKATDGTWSVTYPEFSNLKGEKFKPEGLTNNKVTEVNLNKALGKSNTKATK